MVVGKAQTAEESWAQEIKNKESGTDMDGKLYTYEIDLAEEDEEKDG